ncbi:HU family DNA-binding protein [Tumebacillus flagellatus]|jgi:DNA-binding protein HU-beta|uniref:DNA-binding protein n=1 Tax=Tumebacillus flagellatus TaxID=1157490 RepID=A0A074LRM5_9BACL|nr:HU family DNA-binding protein [Tumebacillus flagellatus]KEO83105.1 DNA-binding protein [Tumebacillus flagellatus]
MNKVELIAAVSEKSGLKKKDAELAVNSLLDTIEEALKSGDKVQLIGFGTFETRKRAARSGRNPKTGEEITIPESVIPAFKPGNKLKEATK